MSKSRDDKIIENIVNRRRNNKICTIPRANTLQMVKLEAVRRAKADKFSRIIYMKGGGELCIRLVGQDKKGDQTSLCHVGHDGNIVDII